MNHNHITNDKGMENNIISLIEPEKSKVVQKDYN